MPAEGIGHGREREGEEKQSVPGPPVRERREMGGGRVEKKLEVLGCFLQINLELERVMACGFRKPRVKRTINPQNLLF